LFAYTVKFQFSSLAASKQIRVGLRTFVISNPKSFLGKEIWDVPADAPELRENSNTQRKKLFDKHFHQTEKWKYGTSELVQHTPTPTYQ
jgi:hypothetical protein